MKEGVDDGNGVGGMDGPAEGSTDGIKVDGLSVGADDGVEEEGFSLGVLVGNRDGDTDGITLGVFVG